MAKAKLIPPYGGKLVNLVVEGKERDELLARTASLPSIKITMRNLCDLELIASGGFSPLTSFMGKADYERVLHEMRLADGTPGPPPKGAFLPGTAGHQWRAPRPAPPENNRQRGDNFAAANRSNGRQFWQGRHLPSGFSLGAG